MTFYNTELNYFLSTNTKVLSSTLRKQRNLTRVGGVRVFMQSLYEVLRVRRASHYLLVRDPYSRVESFFKEKLRKCIRQTTETPAYVLKLHQEIFYPYLGINKRDDIEVIKAKFFQLKFDQFVALLPKVYELDEHLRPQTRLVHTKLRDTIPYRLAIDRFLKIEDPSTFDFLNQTLKLETHIRINATQDNWNEIHWTEKELRIVNDLYQQDFKLFEYPVKLKATVV